MSERITIEEAKAGLPRLGLAAVLEKPYHEAGGMDRVIRECAVTEEMGSDLRDRRRGREDLHLLRLLRRSEVERGFALAYPKHRDYFATKDPENFRRIWDVIGSEGADTLMFWTFAPYLFKALKTRGLSDEFAIEKILLWAKDGVSVMSTANQRGPTPSYNRFHLPGLEKYNRPFQYGWVLDENPSHMSHRFTEQETEEIVGILLGELTEQGGAP